VNIEIMRLGVLVALLLLPVIGDAPLRAQDIRPSTPAEPFLVEALDRNPDGRIVEIDLTARVSDVEIAPGRHVRAWTYDGVLPGPLIRARVGDRLIVHLKNELPEPTTIHWHGVRVPIEMDGVPGVSQESVPPGGSFIYSFELRDAGLYWYHPHFMSAAQVGFGLYGALLVEDPDVHARFSALEERVLVLSDIGIGLDGRLESPQSGGPAGMVFGREGAYVLVNGVVHPRISAPAGVPQRWRIVNAAKSRYFYLDLEGQTMIQIGSDGGLQESPVASDLLLVTPGERVDLIVTPQGQAGEELVLRSQLYNRGYGSVEFRLPEDLLTIALTAPPATVPAVPATAREFPPLPVRDASDGKTTVDAESLELVFTLPAMDAQGRSEFRINGEPFWTAVPYKARLGARQIWTLRNDTDWDHPFHLHGFSFLVVDEAGQPVSPRMWKDTVNVPTRATVRLFVEFNERPGEWMFHCHILDHADGGFMGTVLVGDVKPSPHIHEKPK
jgi:FtsP/CotA-like multicopper oxidase with cupredoxin domain